VIKELENVKGFRCETSYQRKMNLDLKNPVRYYSLDNGYNLVTSLCGTYGEFVYHIDWGKERLWSACKGLYDLPDCFFSWVDEGNLVRLKFELVDDTRWLDYFLTL